MVKKKHIRMLLVFVVAIFTLLAINTAMADGPLSESCLFVDANGSSAGVSLAVLPDSAGNWPWEVVSGSAKAYKWVYQVSGAVSGSNMVTALETVCSPLPELGYALEGGGQVNSPGAGDTAAANYYGINNWQEYAVRMAYASTSTGIPAYSFLTTSNSGEFRNTSMQLKMGNKYYYCHNIKGPDCNRVPDYVPVPTVENTTFWGFPTEITRDQRTGCAKSVRYFDNRETLDDGTTNPNYNQWVVSPPVPGGTLDGHSVVSCGSSNGNQRCQECIINVHSIRCTTLYSGGYATKVPAGCI